jgi:hypothetical protein
MDRPDSMKNNTIIKFNGSTLMTVPAIHYQAIFAGEVFRICSDERTRPDAIAVELNPHVVFEIVNWMKELGVGSKEKIMLPCMLGILVKNRLISPVYRDSALFLQEYFRRPLDNISSVLLDHLLHFSSHNLIGLSSTDSIIEAIRSAVELQIPVYGVDMDEFAPGANTQLLIEDPTNTSFSLSDYVSRNGKATTRMRDPYVDGRREHVMAARLKNILAEYRRVLFTGGLGHWEMINELLLNTSVKPADYLFSKSVPDYTRVLLHPKIAIHFMDAYPIQTTHYEENRIHPFLSVDKNVHLKNTETVLNNILQLTYLQYFTETKPEQLNKSGNESQRIPDFERLIKGMRMLKQQKHTSMSTLLEVAHSMMSEDFIQILSFQLMEIGRSWATLKDFPDLPLISNTHPEKSGRSQCFPENHYQLIETQSNDPESNSVHKKGSKPFIVKFNSEYQTDNHLLRNWDWIDEPKEKTRKGLWNQWVWPPCEALLFGTAYEAAQLAVSASNEIESAAFEGSIYNGLDVKATVRSLINGERKIFIHKPSSTKKVCIPDGKKPEPTVFIFEDSVDLNSYWTLLIGGENLGKYIKNKSRYEKIVNQYGSSFISSISTTSQMETPAHLKPYIGSISLINGLTAFGSPCMNAYQGAEWVEDNDFQCCPVLPFISFNALIEDYQNRHHMDMSNDDWQTALIRFAIPYAREQVVIVAPDGYRISPSLHAESKRKRISLSVIPLTYFPAERVAEMRKRVFVSALDSDGLNFSPEIEKALGQKANQFFELLPPYMQQQLYK